MQGCYVCDRNAAGNDLHGWERVHDHDHWRLALAFDTPLPGWLVGAAQAQVLGEQAVEPEAVAER